MKGLTVIDLFCGAGGFSEGFRQQGFRIIAGYDHWKPAVDTFNYNFGKEKGKLQDILEFEKSVDLIERIPDSNVILGSPPCVSFSSSNQSGKADKSLGLRLTKVFLKIVAVKKYKKESILKAWFMENVEKSIDHVSENYTFSQLGLGKWAQENGYNPRSIALRLKQNHAVINAADYGSPQQRIRAVAGEIISEGRLIIPKTSHAPAAANKGLPAYLTLQKIRKQLPSPNVKRGFRMINDPLYEDIRIKLSHLTDQFYDTGLYLCEWKRSKDQKINHPYMGRMSFPENENKPSRTITATTIGTSREAIIYRSEYNRKGHGEFRIPTARESATLMSFPITFQFLGSEGTKCRLIGNAVCPSVSRALAATVRSSIGLPKKRKLVVQRIICSSMVNNLNTFMPKQFDDPPKKKQGARFRRHPFKDGNITVTLSNYYIEKSERSINKWITSVQYGNGEGFPSYNYVDGYYKFIEPMIKKMIKGQEFLKKINNGFISKIANREKLQDLYENNSSQNGYLEPSQLIENLISLIDGLKIEKEIFAQHNKLIFKNKTYVPLKQLFALYAINKITTITNK